MEISEATRLELVSLLQHLGAKIGVSDGGKDDLDREAERHIQAIHDFVKRIVQRGKIDVFASYLLDQLELLATVCVDASTKGVLRITEHQFGTAQLLMNAFGDKRLFRYTWRISPGQRLFEDVAWRKHFELTSSLAISGAIEIRTLLIMPGLRACEAANIEKVMGFFATQENMLAKIVTDANWDACVVDHGISANCIEFVIYGANLPLRGQCLCAGFARQLVEECGRDRTLHAFFRSDLKAIRRAFWQALRGCCVDRLSRQNNSGQKGALRRDASGANDPKRTSARPSGIPV